MEVFADEMDSSDTELEDSRIADDTAITAALEIAGLESEALENGGLSFPPELECLSDLALLDDMLTGSLGVSGGADERLESDGMDVAALADALDLMAVFTDESKLGDDDSEDDFALESLGASAAVLEGEALPTLSEFEYLVGSELIESTFGEGASALSNFELEASDEDADDLFMAEVAGANSVSESVSQLLGILVAELPQIEVAVREWLGLLGSPEVTAEIKNEAGGTIQELFGRLQMASESMGLEGLSRVCECVIINIALADSEQDQSHWAQILLLVRNYLNAPLADGVAEDLATFFAQPELVDPLGEVDLATLTLALARPDFSLFEEEEVNRPREATAELVSLQVSDDVSPELLEGLLQELPHYSEEFSLAVQRLISGGSMDDVNDAQRVAHTLKGAGNVVGIRGVAELTHHLEDILTVLAKHEMLPPRALADTMMRASDCLEGMSEALQGMASAPDNAQQVLQEVLDWANLIDREGPPDADSAVPVAPSPLGVNALQPVLDSIPASISSQEERTLNEPAEKPTSMAAVPTDQSSQAGGGKNEETTLRVPASLVDNLLRLVGEATILNAQLHERVQQTQEQTYLLEAQFDNIRQLGAELEELVDVKDFSGRNAVAGDFDALEMDQYNELHSYSRRMIEAAVDAKEMGQGILGELDTLSDMIVNQGQLNSETHEGVLKTRMVQVGSVFPRLQRCARQTCRTTGKQVDLLLTGGDTLMDSGVLRDVVDPVMHLLRNAIDHGIETADIREAKGKSATGKLELAFSRDGNHIRVRCKDDGAGLDYEAIRATALRNGDFGETDVLGDEELKRLILRPNFTTRNNVTQVSGRGIGLNAVYGQVLGMKGTLRLDSVSGQGCTMDIRLPVTLLSTHALLVLVDRHTYALASRGIERIIHAEEGEFSYFGGELVYQVDRQPYRVRRLANVLGLEAEFSANTQHPGTVILMKVDDRIEAVLVDAVIGSRELVVKTLGQYMPKLNGIVGATILGDGQVSPVLDLVEMLREPIEFEQRAINEYGRASNEASNHLPVAIVVDDSLSARRALAQLLTDSGYEVKTARDGLEAVDLLSTVKPDIMFVDMEMPRMNGIELASHVRSRGGFEHLPMIMITSRSTEKHRRQAQDAGINLYLTKPFSDDVLIEKAQELMGSLV